MGGRSGKVHLSDTSFMRRMNAVCTSKDELMAFNEAVNELDPVLRNFMGHAMVGAELHPSEVDKITALMCRMEALTRLIREDGAKGWTQPERSDGTVIAQEEVFAAAAVEPLVDRNDRICFNKRTFVQRVLALAEVESEPQ